MFYINVLLKEIMGKLDSTEKKHNLARTVFLLYFFKLKLKEISRLRNSAFFRKANYDQLLILCSNT